MGQRRPGDEASIPMIPKDTGVSFMFVPSLYISYLKSMHFYWLLGLCILSGLPSAIPCTKLVWVMQGALQNNGSCVVIQVVCSMWTNAGLMRKQRMSALLLSVTAIIVVACYLYGLAKERMKKVKEKGENGIRSIQVCCSWKHGVTIKVTVHCNVTQWASF